MVHRGRPDARFSGRAVASLILLSLLAANVAAGLSVADVDAAHAAHGVGLPEPGRAATGGTLRADGTERFEAIPPRAPAAAGDAPAPGAPARAHAPMDAAPAIPRLEPAAPWLNLLAGDGGDAAQDEHGAIQFVCPESDGTDFVSTDGLAQTVVVRANCPFRVIDDQDLLGSPQVAVDPDDPNKLAFFSLHGSATDQGATERSRSTASGTLGARQSHTTFTSVTQGMQWQDNPHGREGYGEMADGIMDRSGRIYSTYLFSSPIGVVDDETVFDFHFQLYHDNDVTDGMSHFGTKVRNRDAGNAIEEVNLVLVTPRTQIESQQEYEALQNRTEERADPFNGTAAPASDDQVGQRADGRPGNYTDDPRQDVVVAVWHERAYDHRNSTTGKSSWIDAVWTRVGNETDWHHLDQSQLIGPCRDASDPAAFNGRVYVACVVDAGYTARAGATIGEIDVWAIDPITGETERMSTVPGMEGGRPRLAMNADGRMVLATTKLLGEGPSHDAAMTFLSWGWYGSRWDGTPVPVIDFAGLWYEEILEARVTAMELMDGTHSLFLSYSERGNNTLGSPTVDPNGNEPVSPNDFIEYGKLLTKFQHCRANALLLYDLQVGQVRHPFQEGIVNNQTGAFDDLQDGMATWIHPDTGEPFVYFVYGDHGVVQYGAFSGLSSGSSPCIPGPVPPLFSPPPPIPASLAPPVGAPLGLSMAAGLASTAALTLLVRRKRASIVALATKAK